MDTLHISSLTVMTKIGVYAWEQKIVQPLHIDLTLTANLSDCEDTLANTVDYEKLCQMVTNFLETNSFALIETVAEQIAQLIKDNFNVAELTVTVNKPHAIKNAKGVGVTIRR